MSTPYEPEPLNQDEAPQLAETLERELRRVSIGLQTRLDIDTSFEPDVANPRDGMLRYFDALTYDPGQGTGLYVYTGGQWRRLEFAP